jgi:hypothetical protein
MANPSPPFYRLKMSKGTGQGSRSSTVTPVDRFNEGVAQGESEGGGGGGGGGGEGWLEARPADDYRALPALNILALGDGTHDIGASEDVLVGNLTLNGGPTSVDLIPGTGIRSVLPVSGSGLSRNVSMFPYVDMGGVGGILEGIGSNDKWCVQMAWELGAGHPPFTNDNASFNIFDIYGTDPANYRLIRKLGRSGSLHQFEGTFAWRAGSYSSADGRVPTSTVAQGVKYLSEMTFSRGWVQVRRSVFTDFTVRPETMTLIDEFPLITNHGPGSSPPTGQLPNWDLTADPFTTRWSYTNGNGTTPGAQTMDVLGYHFWKMESDPA